MRHKDHQELLLTGDQETGIIIPRDDLDEMVRAAAHFMDDDARRQQASLRARRHAISAFSIVGEARRLGAVYTAL